MPAGCGGRAVTAVALKSATGGDAPARRRVDRGRAHRGRAASGATTPCGTTPRSSTTGRRSVPARRRGDRRAIVATVPGEVIDDLRTVQANVRTFAQHQRESMPASRWRPQPGVFLGQKHLPIAAAGAYIPGGRYPLTASAHMTVVTAKVAGVERVAACTPPIRGEIPAATVAAMHLAGADEIFLLGGVQAVAAMAVGTETIGQGRPPRRSGQRLRGGGQAPAVRRGGDRPVRGPHRDPRRRRRQRRSLRRRGRPAQPGGARAGLPGGADHHDRGVARGRWRHDRPRCCPRCRPATWPGPPGATTGRCTSSTTSTRRTGWPTLRQRAREILTEQPREALEKMRNYGALFLGEGTCVSYGDK